MGAIVIYWSLPPRLPHGLPTASGCITKRCGRNAYTRSELTVTRRLCACGATRPWPRRRPMARLLCAARFQNANEIYKAKPEDDERSRARHTVPEVARASLADRAPLLSPDARWIAVPLNDRGTTNIWAIPTDGGSYRRTD